MKCATYKLGSEPKIVLIVYDPTTGQPLPVSAATVIQMNFKPVAGGAIINKTGELYSDGTDGKIAYTVQGEEFAVGRWKVEGFVTLGVAPNEQDLYSTSASFEVEPRLS